MSSNAVGSAEIINGQVSGLDLAPVVRAVLISLIHATTTGPVTVGGTNFSDVLSRQLPSAGDEGLRLIDGNVEATNPNSSGFVRMQVGIFSATLPPECLDITKRFMNNPVNILVKQEELATT